MEYSKPIKNDVAVIKYEKTENGFKEVGADKYEISYTLNQKKLDIVVNGYKTKEYVNVRSNHFHFRLSILRAMSDFRNRPEMLKMNTQPLATMQDVREKWGTEATHVVNHHLLSINKITKRDVITKHQLADINE